MSEEEKNSNEESLQIGPSIEGVKKSSVTPEDFSDIWIPDALPSSDDFEELLLESTGVEEPTRRNNFSEPVDIAQQELSHWIEASSYWENRFHGTNEVIKQLETVAANLVRKVEHLDTDLQRKNIEKENIIESLPHGLIVTDITGKVLSFNRSAEKITGKNKRQLLGRDVAEIIGEELLPSTDDDERLEKIKEDYRKEHFLNSADGQKQYLESSTSLISEKEYLPEKPAIIINLRDITKIKSLEKEAERKNRLTAMGEIAANVAHEIRNPLGSIELFVSTMKLDFEDDPDKEEICEHILSGVRSMNHIISNLLGYAKPKSIILSKIDLAKILSEFIGFSSHLAAHQGIDLTTDIPSEPLFIMGERESLLQVFHNLLTNAIQAMQDGGPLELWLRVKMESDPVKLAAMDAISSVSSLANERQVAEICFKDSGKGMPPEVLRRVFDPFFTTKEKGSGLGMSIIRSIAHSHHALIDVESELDKGTIVRLIFPLLLIE